MKKLLLVSLCLLTLCVTTVFAQNRTVTGTVTAKDDGLPIPGATVKIKGTSTGAATDVNGKFSITTSAGATLTFSSIGYLSQDVAVGASNVISVTLAPSSKELSEVVLIGYQTIRKKDLVGALSVVDSSKFTEKPQPSFLQMLQGTAPGIQATTGSGRPSDNAIIRIRGVGSIGVGTGANTASDPLVVLDGIQISSSAYNALNPDDIENVTILKDASAVAIYGSRGSNGVILVTTKTGKANQPTLKYSFRYGKDQRQPFNTVHLMNSQEKFQYELEAKYTNPILDTMITNRGYAAVRPVPNTPDNAGTAINFITPAQRQTIWDLAASRGAGDWDQYLFQKATLRTHELSLSGGSDKLTYYMSANISDHAGIERFSGFDKKGGRLNVTYQVKPWFKVGSNIGVTTSHEAQVREAYNTQNSFGALFFFNPYEPTNLADGSLNPSFNGFSPIEGAVNNPLTYDRVNSFGSFYGEATFFKHLTLKSVYAINYNTRNSQSYVQPGSNLATILGYNQKTDGIQQDFFYSITNTANWTQTIKGKHNINILVGNEFDKDNFYSLSATGRTFPSKSYTTLENAATPITTTSSITQYSLISYFGSANYNYDQRYYFTASGRRDGSSRFGTNVQFANFGAVGVAWDLRNEKFFTLPSYVSELKLRASIGTSGNNAIAAYQAYGTYGLTTKYNDQIAAIPANIANPNLTWETSYSKDIGLTYGFLDSRISGELDYYSRENKNLLYPVNLSATTGFASYTGNVGAVRNSGLEFNIKGDVIRTKDLKWSLNFQYTSVNNKVTQLYSDNAAGVVNTFGFQKLVVGQPINVYYMVKDGGVNPVDGKQQYVNLDGTLTETYAGSQSQVLGGKSANVKYYGSFGTTLAYKGIDFSTSFYYSGGNYIYNTVWQDEVSSSDYNVNLFTEAFDYWKKPGDITKYPRLLDPATGLRDPISQQENTTDKFLEKGDYISLRDVTLGYTFPNKLTKKAGIAGLRVFAQGTNLAVWSKFHGNPEVGSSGETAAFNGSNYRYGYPPIKSWTIGVDVRF